MRAARGSWTTVATCLPAAPLTGVEGAVADPNTGVVVEGWGARAEEEGGRAGEAAVGGGEGGCTYPICIASILGDGGFCCQGVWEAAACV